MKGPVEFDNSPNPREGNMTSSSTSANKEPDFSEYMWMGEVELEDFDRKVEEELREQEFIDQCFEDLLNEQQQDEEWFYAADYENFLVTEGLNNLNLNHQQQVQVHYQLNPDAPEFVPSSMKQLGIHSQEQER